MKSVIFLFQCDRQDHLISLNPFLIDVYRMEFYFEAALFRINKLDITITNKNPNVLFDTV